MGIFDSLVKTYVDSIYQKDLNAYASIFDEDIIAYDLWNDWSITGITAWKEMAKNWFEELGSIKDVVEFGRIKVATSDKLATLTAIVKFSGVDERGTTLRFLNNRLTWVAANKNGEWKIIHQHASVPISFPDLKGNLHMSL